MRHLANVPTVDPDRTALDVVEAQQKVGQGALAAAARADQGDHLAARDPQRHVAQNRLCVVAKADVVEQNLVAQSPAR